MFNPQTLPQMDNRPAPQPPVQNIPGEIITDEKKTRNLSTEELQKILEEIRRKLDYFNIQLKIDIDKDLEIPVVKIINIETNEVIRQIPPEYLLELMKKIDQMLGILLERRE
ncbi:flagellar protein FlaG [Thermocrinis minervae]|nr:flagellar protein FlaG [Thermocrinis minervae]